MHFNRLHKGEKNIIYSRDNFLLPLETFEEGERCLPGHRSPLGGLCLVRFKSFLSRLFDGTFAHILSLSKLNLYLFEMPSDAIEIKTSERTAPYRFRY